MRVRMRKREPDAFLRELFVLLLMGFSTTLTGVGLVEALRGATCGGGRRSCTTDTNVNESLRLAL